MSDKIQRLIEAELGIDELMVSNREIREQIDAVDIQPLTRHARDGRESFHRRRGIADTRRVANKRKQRLCDTALTVGDLQHRFAGDLIDGRLKRGGQRAIDRRDRHNDGNAEGDPKESQRRAQPVALHMAP